MNFSPIQNVLASTFTYFEDQMIKSLTAQQKKVAWVATAVFALFATSYILYRHACFKATKDHPDSETDKPDPQNSSSDAKLDPLDPTPASTNGSKFEEVKKKVEENGLELKNYPEYQSNRIIVKIAVQNHGWALQFAPDFQDDDEIVELSIQQSPYASQFASERLQGVLKIVEPAVAKDGYTVQFATEKLRKESRDLAKLAVSGPHGNGLALEFLPAFQNDEEIVELAFKQNPKALDFASKELKAKFEKSVEVVI